MQVTQAEGYYGDHTDYVEEWQDGAYTCYVGRVAGWRLYVLCRRSGRMVLICVM
jgi:hypothetical protein